MVIHRHVGARTGRLTVLRVAREIAPVRCRRHREVVAVARANTEGTVSRGIETGRDNRRGAAVAPPPHVVGLATDDIAGDHVFARIGALSAAEKTLQQPWLPLRGGNPALATAIVGFKRRNQLAARPPAAFLPDLAALQTAEIALHARCSARQRAAGAIRTEEAAAGSAHLTPHLCNLGPLLRDGRTPFARACATAGELSLDLAADAAAGRSLRDIRRGKSRACDQRGCENMPKYATRHLVPCRRPCAPAFLVRPS